MKKWNAKAEWLKKAAADGKASLVAGALFGAGSIACPCPLCLSATALFLGNGVAKLRKK